MRRNTPTSMVGHVDPSNVQDLGLALQIRVLQENIERLNARADEMERELASVKDAYTGQGKWAFPKVIGGKGINVTQMDRRISIEAD